MQQQPTMMTIKQSAKKVTFGSLEEEKSTSTGRMRASTRRCMKEERAAGHGARIAVFFSGTRDCHFTQPLRTIIIKRPFIYIYIYIYIHIYKHSPTSTCAYSLLYIYKYMIFHCLLVSSRVRLLFH